MHNAYDYWLQKNFIPENLLALAMVEIFLSQIIACAFILFTELQFSPKFTCLNTHVSIAVEHKSQGSHAIVHDGNNSLYSNNHLHSCICFNVIRTLFAYQIQTQSICVFLITRAIF